MRMAFSTPQKAELPWVVHEGAAPRETSGLPSLPSSSTCVHVFSTHSVRSCPQGKSKPHSPLLPPAPCLSASAPHPSFRHSRRANPVLMPSPLSGDISGPACAYSLSVPIPGALSEGLKFCPDFFPPLKGRRLPPHL